MASNTSQSLQMLTVSDDFWLRLDLEFTASPLFRGGRGFCSRARNGVQSPIGQLVRAHIRAFCATATLRFSFCVHDAKRTRCNFV